MRYTALHALLTRVCPVALTLPAMLACADSGSEMTPTAATSEANPAAIIYATGDVAGCPVWYQDEVTADLDRKSVV